MSGDRSKQYSKEAWDLLKIGNVKAARDRMQDAVRETRSPAYRKVYEGHRDKIGKGLIFWCEKEKRWVIK